MQAGPASEGGRHASHQSFFLILTALSLNFIPSCRAQEKPAGKVQVMGFVPAVTSSSGPRAESLEAAAFYEQRYTRLAETMPAGK